MAPLYRDLSPAELRTLAQQANPEQLAKLGSLLLGLPNNRAAHLLGDAVTTWVLAKVAEVGAERALAELLEQGAAQIAAYQLRRLLAEGARVKELHIHDERTKPG